MLGASPRRAIGLFGNSRSIMVNGDQIGAGLGSFANFAVPGSSFRSSVALAEEMARAGKLPETVLISLDHLEIQYDGNPRIRGIWGWSGRMVRDLSAGLSHPNIGWRDTARAAWRHVYVGYQGLARYFNVEQLAAGLRWQLAGGRAARWWLGQPIAGGAGYRNDGSRSAGKAPTARQMVPISRAAPSVLAGYLIEDLRRLAALKRSGARIIVYESPLHGRSAEPLITQPSAHVVALRARFLRACIRLGLECHAHNPGSSLATAPGWTDPTHPPADALAAYLKRLIARAPLSLGQSGSTR